MARGSIKLFGGKELEAALKGLDEKIAKSIARKAVKAGAEPILHAARSMVDIDTGKLLESIVIKTGTRKGKSIFATVGTKAGDYKGQTFYGSFLEYGHYAGSRRIGNARTWVPARPFLRPAFDQNVHKSTNIIQNTLANEIAKEAVRAAKRAAKAGGE